MGVTGVWSELNRHRYIADIRMKSEEIGGLLADFVHNNERFTPVGLIS